MSMKVSVFDRLGVKKCKKRKKNKHKFIFKMRLPFEKHKLFINDCEDTYDNLSNEYDVIVNNYKMEFNSLQYPFINNDSRKTKPSETKTSGILPLPSKPTCDSRKSFAELIISSLMVNQTICTLREKANGPTTKLFENSGDKITITVLNINISNDVKNLSSNFESGKLEKNMEKNPPYIRKVIITPNENETLANNCGPIKHSDFENIKNNSDQNKLLKKIKHSQSNLQETESIYIVRTTNKTQNSKHTKEEQTHIKCEVDTSSDNEKQSHPNRRLESVKPMESKTKIGITSTMKSFSFVGTKNQIQNSKHTDEEQTHLKCEVDPSSDNEKQSHPNRRLESVKPMESKTKIGITSTMKSFSFVGTKNQIQNSKHTDEEQTHLKCDVDPSSDDEKESHPNRRLDLEKPLESKTKRRITSPIMNSKSKRLKSTLEKPGASYFWERVLKTPAFWKEEFPYSVTKSHDNNCSSVEKESELNFQAMLAQFRTFNFQQNMEAKKMPYHKRFGVGLNLTGCLADTVFISPEN